MRLVFRADSSKEIGVGHVMRICAIAEKAISRGIDCVFVGDLGGILWVEDYVTSLGFVEVLKKDQSGCSPSTEDILILDSYTISPTEKFLAKSAWRRVVNIFDEVTPKYDANVNIHPGMGFPGIEHIEGSVYSGPEYISFRQSIKKSDAISPRVNRVLVFAGGTDPHNLALEIAQYLATISSFSEAIFVCNQESQIKNLDSRFSTVPFGVDLDKLVEMSDLVITSASTASFEVAVRGIPVGVIAVADNQHAYYAKVMKSGFAAALGVRTEDGLWKINQDAIFELFDIPSARRLLRENSLAIFDLEGSGRVLDLIIST